MIERAGSHPRPDRDDVTRRRPVDASARGGAAAESLPEGIWTALATPFVESDERVDLEALSASIDRQVRAGIAGLVRCGTPGEVASLDRAEWESVVRATLDAAAGRVPVLAGAGSASTREAIWRTERAAELGARGVLQIVPYYVRPTSAGIVRHFSEIGRVGLPIVVYDVPSRVGVGLDAEIYQSLEDVDAVVATKDASGDLGVATRLIEESRLQHFSGDDGLLVPHASIGSQGAISVLSNVEPEWTRRVFEAARGGESERARRGHAALAPLVRALFLESNPIPVKEALRQRGVFPNEIVRTPLSRATAGTARRIRDALARLDRELASEPTSPSRN